MDVKYGTSGQRRLRRVIIITFAINSINRCSSVQSVVATMDLLAYVCTGMGLLCYRYTVVVWDKNA